MDFKKIPLMSDVKKNSITILLKMIQTSNSISCKEDSYEELLSIFLINVELRTSSFLS